MFESQKEYKLGELLKYVQPTAFIVNSTEYVDTYETPVLTAGKTFIIGYTNETEGIFTKLPVIIFDDFTTSIQYVDFPFKVKSSAMKILIPNLKLVIPKYIFYRMLMLNVDHSTHKRYWIQTVSKIKIKIPNIDDQKRIVAKIEELFSNLDASVAELQMAKEKLGLYRQAVLKEAFEGEFSCLALKNISKAISGYAFKSKYYTSQGKYIVVKIGNVKERRFYFKKDLTRTNEVNAKILDKYLLTPGDCLITLTGSRGKRDYGFVVMVEDERKYLLNQRVAALRFDKTIALPEFYEYYLSSPNYREQFFSYETGNVGQGNVGIKALEEPLVICPSLEEQNNIVNKIKFQLSIYERIIQIINVSMQQSSVFRKSILKQAFEGEL